MSDIRIEAYAKEGNNGGYKGVCRVFEDYKETNIFETDCKSYLKFRDAELAAYALRADLCPEVYDTDYWRGMKLT